MSRPRAAWPRSCKPPRSAILPGRPSDRPKKVSAQQTGEDGGVGRGRRRLRMELKCSISMQGTNGCYFNSFNFGFTWFVILTNKGLRLVLDFKILMMGQWGRDSAQQHAPEVRVKYSGEKRCKNVEPVCAQGWGWGASFIRLQPLGETCTHLTHETCDMDL